MAKVYLLPIRLSQPHSRPLISVSLSHRIVMPDRDENISFRLGRVPRGAYILQAKNRA